MATTAPATRSTRLEPPSEWLLASREPAVRWLTLTEVLGRPDSDAQVSRERAAIPEGPIVSRLLRFDDDLDKALHPYGKWAGAHWRLVSLIRLGLEPGHPRALAEYDRVLGWLTGKGHLAGVKVISGRARRCGSQEGNALAVGVRLGLADDPRVQLLAENLVGWQWDDGGWNCDVRPGAAHSSVNESVTPLWGLAEYAAATGDKAARAAAKRTSEFLLRHRVFLSERTGEPMNERVAEIHWPPYWRYDLLQGMTMLALAGALPDRRADDAVDALLALRQDDGAWRATKRWWRPPREKPAVGASAVEAVDWREDDTEDRILTILALSALKGQGRL